MEACFLTFAKWIKKNGSEVVINKQFSFCKSNDDYRCLIYTAGTGTFKDLMIQSCPDVDTSEPSNRTGLSVSAG